MHWGIKIPTYAAIFLALSCCLIFIQPAHAQSIGDAANAAGTVLSAINPITGIPTLAGAAGQAVAPKATEVASVSIAGWIAQIIYVFTVGLGGLVAAVASDILNFAVSISLDSAAYGLDFISVGWTIIRDLANMAFIFILVYIALQVMFQAQTHGTIERLVKVLAVALIINFSFFATRVVVDAGNLLSVQFYNAIVKDAQQTGSITPIAGVSGGPPVPDLTAKIMGGIKIAAALGPEAFTQASNGNPGFEFGAAFISFAFIYIAVGAILFMLAAAFVTAGVKFIVRIVMLWMSIITAPLALLVWSFQSGHGGGGHGHGNYFDTWRKNLISHAFYPVVFLFVLFLISTFMQSLGDLSTSISGFAGAATNAAQQGESGNASLVELIANIVVRLGFVLVMLYFALKASDYFEVAASGVAKQIGERFSLGGLAGYRRGVTWAGRLAARPVVAPVTQFTGMGAYDLNKALKKVPVVNTLTQPLRQNVLQPLSKASLVGEKSFDQLNKEAAARGLIDKALNNPAELTDKEKKDLNHTSTEVFAAFSVSKLQRLIDSGALDDSGKKHIDDIKTLSEDDKHNLDHAWEERKGRESNEALEKIDDKLGTLIATTDAGSVEVKRLLRESNVLSKKNAKAIKTAIQDKLDTIHSDGKEHEMRLQTTIQQIAEAEKRGDEGEVIRLTEVKNSIKKDIATNKSLERNANDGLKRVDQAPKEKADKDRH